MGLSSSSGQQTILKLNVTGTSARGGQIAEFAQDSNDPVDFADRDLEISNNGGKTW